MLDLITLLDISSGAELCNEIAFLLKVVGIVIWAIKVFVPVALLIYGMLDFTSAVMGKKDEDIKAAQKKLMNRAIAAVIVFCVVSIVNLLMNFVGADDYKSCTKCINDPFGECDVDLGQNLGN